MSKISIFHNPRCSKSRKALAILHEEGHEPDIILYLEQTPDTAAIASVLSKLGLSAADILRRGEAEYKAHFKDITDEDELISLMVRFPKVIERPIIISGDRAVIGRPPEAVRKLL